MDVAATRSGGGVTAVVEYDYTAKEADELDLTKGAILHSIKQMPGGWWEGTLQANGKTGMFPDNFVRIVDASASAANDDNTVTLREKSATTNRRCKVIFSYTQVNDDELSLAVGDVIEFLGEVEEGWWRGRLKSKIGVFPSNFVTAIEPSPILASKRPTPAASTATATATATNTATGKHTTSAAAAAAAAAASTKKMNRLSFHSSKEDLLSSNQQPSTATSSSSAAAAAATLDEAAPSLPPKPQREYCRVEFPYAPQNDDELELKVGDIITIISMELPDKGWWKGELRGKVGVFPDNFVKLLAPSDVSPLNDSQQSQQQAPRTAKSGATASTAAASTNLSAPTLTGAGASGASATTSKVFIKKSGSTSSTQSSNRKDSFGSRDSLNDILSETGLPSGNVAAQRKSLENKNLDLSNAPDASTRLGLKKPQQHTLQETKTILSSSSSNSNHHTTTTTTTSSSNPYNDLRKTLDNMDEKVKTPPPVLTKKPTVPSKKTTTVTSVAGNIFSGIKQKVKNVENKLTTAASHDYADGIGSSRMSPGGLPDAAPGGNVVMRRAATIAVEDSDFDRVERASMLPDVRAGRVKAPKRRPPSAAINAIGESNNNDSTYLNGSNGSAELHVHSDGDGKPQSSDDNSTGEEQLAKPKPREWEKKKAPWMEELKASQVKKKTSPNVEPRTLGAGSSSSVAERTSKLLSEDVKIGGSSSNAYAAHSTTSVTNSSNATSSASSSSTTTVTTTKVQSSAVTSSLMQQSLHTESSQQVLRKEQSASTVSDAMIKSMSSKYAAETTSTASTHAATEELRAPRPNSLSIRNRSTSPSLVAASSSNSNNTAAASVAGAPATSSVNTSSAAAKAAAPASVVVNNHHQENNVAAVSKTNASTSDAPRVIELERRVGKLEAVVHAQQRTIDELVRTLREETDRVKVLRGELDKYAQCVTQV